MDFSGMSANNGSPSYTGPQINNGSPVTAFRDSARNGANGSHSYTGHETGRTLFPTHRQRTDGDSFDDFMNFQIPQGRQPVRSNLHSAYQDTTGTGNSPSASYGWHAPLGASTSARAPFADVGRRGVTVPVPRYNFPSLSDIYHGGMNQETGGPSLSGSAMRDRNADSSQGRDEFVQGLLKKIERLQVENREIERLRVENRGLKSVNTNIYTMVAEYDVCKDCRERNGFERKVPNGTVFNRKDLDKAEKELAELAEEFTAFKKIATAKIEDLTEEIAVFRKATVAKMQGHHYGTPRQQSSPCDPDRPASAYDCSQRLAVTTSPAGFSSQPVLTPPPSANWSPSGFLLQTDEAVEGGLSQYSPLQQGPPQPALDGPSSSRPSRQSSLSKPPSSKTVPNGKAMSWSDAVQKPKVPSPPRGPKASTLTPQVLRNRHGQRVDPPVKYDQKEVDKIKAMKLCNKHFLLRDCHYPNCKHSHEGQLDQNQFKLLQQVARMSPCLNGSACADAGCIYGHVCPAPAKAGELCIFGAGCKFIELNLHKIDRVVYTKDGVRV